MSEQGQVVHVGLGGKGICGCLLLSNEDGIELVRWGTRPPSISTAALVPQAEGLQMHSLGQRGFLLP